MGSGNQSQREVWCTLCHQRWLVDPQAMMDLAAKKTEVQVGDKVLRAGQSRVETPVAGKNSVKMLRTPTSGGYVRQPDTPLRTQGSMETPPMTPPRLPMRQEEVLCFCGQPAEKLMVKKETARKGRRFYKCLRRVCDFFQWDPKEVRDIQLRESPPAMRQAAEDEVLEIHRQEVQQVIHSTMAEACREASYSDDGGSTPSVPISAGPVTQSVSVDDGSGWRGEVGKDHERSSAAGRNESQGSGAEAELGRDGEASSGQLRGRWQQHVDMEKIEEAPWACVLENRAQWEKWRMMQRKSEDLRSYERQAAYGGWTKRENGGWVEYKGILPNYEPGSRAIGVFYEGGAWMADEEYEEASKSLSRSSRRAVQKRMRQMVVAEVYSNPRVAKEAVEMGHRSGGSYDLGTGYDFSKASERRLRILIFWFFVLHVVPFHCYRSSTMERWSSARQ